MQCILDKPLKVLATHYQHLPGLGLALAEVHHIGQSQLLIAEKKMIKSGYLSNSSIHGTREPTSKKTNLKVYLFFAEPEN